VGALRRDRGKARTTDVERSMTSWAKEKRGKKKVWVKRASGSDVGGGGTTLPVGVVFTEIPTKEGEDEREASNVMAPNEREVAIPTIGGAQRYMNTVGANKRKAGAIGGV